MKFLLSKLCDQLKNWFDACYKFNLVNEMCEAFNDISFKPSFKDSDGWYTLVISVGTCHLFLRYIKENYKVNSYSIVVEETGAKSTVVHYLYCTDKMIEGEVINREIFSAIKAHFELILSIQQSHEQRIKKFLNSNNIDGKISIDLVRDELMLETKALSNMYIFDTFSLYKRFSNLIDLTVADNLKMHQQIVFLIRKIYFDQNYKIEAMWKELQFN